MAKKTHVIAVAATKGGVGKTTLSAALAVRAARDSKRVALIDADNQASLQRWWHLRGTPANPALLDCGCSEEALGWIISEGWEWVFIDTPPAIMTDIIAACSIADFVLIPTRASAIDLAALDHSETICRDLEKPFGFVLNAVETTSRTLNENAVKHLASRGHVMGAQIGYRRAYITAMTRGRSGPETERTEACNAEIDALWDELRSLTTKAR